MPELNYSVLPESFVTDQLASLSGWEREGAKLTKSFSFDSYARGVLFVTTCGHLAEVLNHHPEITLGYQNVRVSISTHEASGLTAFDFELARRMDAVV